MNSGKAGRDEGAPEPKRRTRYIDSRDSFVPETSPDDTAQIFRKRLTHLMNGNNSMGRAVNMQELASSIGISRPAIRKYLKPDENGESTTPSAQVVCKIARFFNTTPNFLLGFDEEQNESLRLAYESEYYNRLGLNQKTIEHLHVLRESAATNPNAAVLLTLLDRLICSFSEEAEGAIELRSRRR